MNHLLRELARISTVGWREIEKETTRTLRTTLAARKLVAFVGPQGWSASAVGAGRSDSIASPTDANVRRRQRKVLPLVGLRVLFEMSREDLDDIERGAKDPDTDAARAIAMAEIARCFTVLPPRAFAASARRRPSRGCRSATITNCSRRW